MRSVRFSSICSAFVCSAAVLLLLIPSVSFSQMLESLQPGRNPVFFAQGTTVHQPETHVSGGGHMTVSRYSLSAGTAVPVNDKLNIGFGLSYEFDDYNFSRLAGFAVPDPWNKIHRVGFANRIGYRTSPEWTLFAAPVLQYAGEQGAEFNHSLLYGGTVGALYRPSKTFMIGFGGGIFYRLEETSFFPALLFSWKITDNLRLGNSFRTGPSGPAGLELAYTIDRNWEAAVAGGYRSYRFRLDSHGPIPNGIGQTDSWPLYARVSRKLGTHLRADLYGGAAFAGKLRAEDRKGHEIDRVSYNTAPLAGFSISMVY